MQNRLISYSFAAVATLLFPVLSVAAQETAPAASPTRVAPFSADEFAVWAVGTLVAIDRDGSGPVYDAASAVMKRAVTRDAFIAAMTQRRTADGVAVSREWVRIERLRVDAPASATQSPAGDYVTVYSLARNAQNAAHVEQVSFRLDEDNRWRLVGVTTLRAAAGEPSSPPSRH